MPETIQKVKSFSFLTNYVDWTEVGHKGNKEYYVTGYISTDEIDRSQEIVTPNAMADMVTQLKTGNIKLDVEHSTFGDNNDIPVGKIVDAKFVQHQSKSKIWIKAVINKSHSKFEEVWKSIKDGFLDAFSIAYKIKESFKDLVNGAEVTLLKSLELLNVAITGNPINKGATMTDSFMKSMEANNMVDENKEEAPKEEAPKEEPKEEAPKEEEPKEEAPKEEPKEEAAPAEEEAPAEEAKEDEASPLDAIKSLTKEVAKLKAELKAFMKKPKMKSLVSEQPEEIAMKVNPMDAIQ